MLCVQHWTPFNMCLESLCQRYCSFNCNSAATCCRMLWKHATRVQFNSLGSWLWEWPLGCAVWWTAHKWEEPRPASQGGWTISYYGCDTKRKLNSAAGVLRSSKKNYLGIVYRAKLICSMYLANRNNHTWENEVVHTQYMASQRGTIYQIYYSLLIVQWSLSKRQIPQRFINQHISAVTGTQYSLWKTSGRWLNT